jgi:hypothetical protein
MQYNFIERQMGWLTFSWSDQRNSRPACQSLAMRAGLSAGQADFSSYGGPAVGWRLNSLFWSPSESLLVEVFLRHLSGGLGKFPDFRLNSPFLELKRKLALVPRPVCASLE